MSQMEQAARVTDPIAHTDNDFAFGLSLTVLAGGALAIVFTPVTLGGAALTIVASASFAHDVGAVIDTHRPKTTEEAITAGAATVFLDVPRHRAAKAAPQTTLSQHGGDWVSSGSDTVYIERCNACCAGDITTCGGTIVNGSSTIFYGYQSRAYAPGTSANPDERIGSSAYQLFERGLVIGDILAAPGRGGTVFEWLRWGTSTAANVGVDVLEGPALAADGYDFPGDVLDILRRAR